MKLFLTLIIFSSMGLSAMAFSLAGSANPPRYSADEVVVNAANDSCSGLGLSPQGLLDLVQEAMDEHWNKVHTSRLKIVSGTIKGFSANGHTELSPFITNNGAVNTIIVGCNDDITGFGSGTVGVGGLGGLNGVGLGGFILYDHSTTAALAKEVKLALIAHEIGHALGLGHSNSNTAMMYYSLNEGGKVQKQLSRDDHDGLTWLYPNEEKAQGCLGSFGTIKDINGEGTEGKTDLDKFPSNFFLSAVLTFSCLQLVFFWRRRRLAANS